MARVKCEICGGNVDTLKGNYIFANGMHQHKSCPRTEAKLSDEEIKDKRDLTDAIQWVTRKQNIFLSKQQWGMINSQIKMLKEQGYSYKEQLTAFKWYFDLSKNNEYQGYGIVGYIIEQALNESKKQDEIKAVTNKEDEMRRIMEQKRLDRHNQGHNSKRV